MNATRMVQVCGLLRQRLDELEFLLYLLTDRQREFVFRSQADLRELSHIAKRETRLRMTMEQVQHLNRIDDGIMAICQTLPNDVAKRFRGRE